MKVIVWILLLGCFQISHAEEDDIEVVNQSFIPSILLCTQENQPRLLKPIENWDIIAGNIAYIDLENYFQGPQLLYSFSVNHKHPGNEIKLDIKTGDLEIQADNQDNFDLTITAANNCGHISSSFNVHIGEEKD